MCFFLNKETFAGLIFKFTCNHSVFLIFYFASCNSYFVANMEHLFEEVIIYNKCTLIISLQCGFFYRRAFHELKLRIEIQKLSAVHLLSAQRNSSSLDTDNDNETFVLTPYPSGSDDTQVMTPPPGYLEATHRTSNSSTDYFFNFDDDDGYLIPVFDSRKNDSPD